MPVKLRREVTVSMETDAVDADGHAVLANVTLPAGSEVPSAHVDAVQAVDDDNGGGYVIDTGEDPGYLRDAGAVDPVRAALLAQVDAKLGDESKTDVRGWSNEQLAQYLNVHEFAKANPSADVDTKAVATSANERNETGNANAPQSAPKSASKSASRGRSGGGSGGADS